MGRLETEEPINVGRVLLFPVRKGKSSALGWALTIKEISVHTIADNVKKALWNLQWHIRNFFGHIAVEKKDFLRKIDREWY